MFWLQQEINYFNPTSYCLDYLAPLDIHFLEFSISCD